MAYKVLLVLSQPTQSTEPLRLLSNMPEIDLTSVFLSGTDKSLWQGEEFINKASLGLSKPDEVNNIEAKNYSPFPSLGSFAGLFHPSLISLVKKNDCIIVYGHAYLSMWIAIIAAKLFRKRLILSNDAISSPRKQAFKSWLKKWLYPFLYNKLADALLVPSSRAKEYQLSLGVSASQIYLTPYVVDNDKIAKIANETEKTKARDKLGLPLNKKIVLFVGKLIERKRPLDLLEAFSKCGTKDSLLVYVGNGPLMGPLKEGIKAKGLADSVICLGELNYRLLIEAYVSSDILVHPAMLEPWGLIVNEAMICGVPVIASDNVGSCGDLIDEFVTGLTYPAGNTVILAEKLNIMLTDEGKRAELALMAKERMKSWSPLENANSHLNAIKEINR